MKLLKRINAEANFGVGSQLKQYDTFNTDRYRLSEALDEFMNVVLDMSDLFYKEFKLDNLLKELNKLDDKLYGVAWDFDDDDD